VLLYDVVEMKCFIIILLLNQDFVSDYTDGY